ncbi:hypothetical protein EC991_003216 [Linnemannia zychae]|nr:hypothetical protein EC991_003216 [Linnemannia zychae]
MVDEPSILQFLAERAELEPRFKDRLFAAVNESKLDSTVSQAAANAISILVKAGVRFNGADLRGIRIPGANIRGGEFDYADIEGADLSDVNLSKAWLRQVNFESTQMEGVYFGELPYLEVGEGVFECKYSVDGNLFVISTQSLRISVYSTPTWTRLANYTGGGSLAISPSCQELARYHNESNVAVGDILTGEARLLLIGHTNLVLYIAYSPDGSMVATASQDTTVRIWSTESGDTLHILRGHTESVTGVAFSPTGLQLTSSIDRTVRTWEAQTGNTLFSLSKHANPVYCVAYLLMAIRSLQEILIEHQHGVVYLWDPNSSDLLDTLSSHVEAVLSATYTPNSTYLASGSLDGTVRLWDVNRVMSDGEPYDSNRELVCVDISPDGARTVTGYSNGIIQLWETQTGKPEAVLRGHSSAVNKARFSPCGKLIASASSDFTVRVWSAGTGTSVHDLQGHTAIVPDVAFSPSNNWIASASYDKTVRMWNVETGEPGRNLVGHTDNVFGVAFSPDGNQVASCGKDKTIRIWCSSTGEQRMVMLHRVEVSRLIYSSDGQELISISWDDYLLYFWDVSSGERVDQRGLQNSNIISCTYSPSNRHFVTSGKDGMLRLWERASGDWVEVYQTLVGAFSAMCWVKSLGRTYLATSVLGSVKIWELDLTQGSYDVRLLWGLGMRESNVADAVGLSPVNLQLLRQGGAVVMA